MHVRNRTAIFCLPAILLLAAAGRSADSAVEAAERPNILLIYTDDQSYKTIGCYEGAFPWVKTPHIDQLARTGVRFQRAYLGAWCMPSRASILTGRLQHGVQTMRMEGTYPGSAYDPEACPFVPAEFRKQGYQTAQIGKWHTGVDAGFGRDWDYQVVWNRPAHPDNAGNYFYDQKLSVNGGEVFVEHRYSTDVYTDLAVDFINGSHRTVDRPWYLWLCYGAIHGPTTPADRHLGIFAEQHADVPADILGPWPQKPAYLNDTKAWIQGKDGRPAMATKVRSASNFDTIAPGLSFDGWIRQVNECNLAVDEGVGRLVDALKASGQLENTLVIYVADQGYGLGEHGLNQKVAPYDSSVASPLIISQPGTVPVDKVCQHPVNAPDLVDLMCRVAGVAIPWKTHGRNLLPLIRDPQTDAWNQPMLMTHTGRIYGSETRLIPDDERLTVVGSVPWYVLLRDGRYKYIRTLVPGETEELYDLASDPEELTNLAALPDQQPRLERLRAVAVEQLKRTDAEFADGMPATMQTQKQTSL